MKRMTRVFGALASGLLLVGAAATSATASAPSLLPPGASIVARQLNNPRQLSWVGESNTLLIAEAGNGGKTCFNDPELGTTCIGATGAIRALKTDGVSKPVRIISGLLSGAGPDGSFATGSDGVSARHLSQIYVQETYAPIALPHLPAFQNGALLRQDTGHALFKFADITAFERNNDPDHQGFDSDPYAVLALSKREIVADAAGNDVLSVDPTGHVSLLTVFPNIQTGACKGRPNDAGTTGCDAVPTSLALGPNGHLYVGQLAGEAPGSGRISEIDLNTGQIVKNYDGFTTITGIAVDTDGTIYASELEGGQGMVPGDVAKIAPNGSITHTPVPFPAGLALDGHRHLYVSAFSIAPATGLQPKTPFDSSGQVWQLKI
jgi:hypothetical protein